MKQKRFFIGVAMAFLVGVMAAFPLFHDSQEPFSGEMPRDKDIEQQSDEAPSALLKITQMSEPVLLGKTGQASGEVAYSFSVKPLTSGIKHISFLSGNPDVKFVEYVLLPEDDSDNVEEGFAENRVLRQSTSQQLSPDGTIPCNATKWLETPVEREVAGGEEVEIHLEFPVKLLPEEGVRPEGSNAWGMDGFSLYALLTDGQGQQALQEIRFEKQDGMSLEASVFSRDLEDVAEIETPSEVITKELHGYRYIYSSPEKVEPVYHYDGTVTGVKEGNAFSELPHGQSV